ncbi:SDR family oxidoreductase [Streptomyces similanensis]|uniref:NAD(P)H-binding protein n=1 Tax=Streptomyces similanensis TaxID=1274988 RepID=A0ABP9KJJ1_9ACTN
MRIAVVGGTGFIGSRLVERLRKAGHEVSAHARNTGLDLLTGEGLPGAVEGAEVVVDTIDAPSFDAAATPFFRTTTRNLLDAAGQAGVGHVVLLSIVGIDRVPQVDYYRAKVAQEDEVKAGPVPYSIVRATQFMEFVPKIMEWTADGDTVRLPTTPLQPVAADEVVEALADVAAGAPLSGTLDVAGPDVLPLDELGRLTLDARPDGRRVVVDESAGLFAAVVGDTVTAPPGARLGRVHYTDLL